MLNHETKLALAGDIFGKCLVILDAKGRDYSGTLDGMSNFRDFGSMGLIVRLGDKWHRVKNVSKKGTAAVKDETLKDTLMDMINYCALTLIMLGEEENEIK